MSGPKVVRIVTREEILAICEQHLARLDAAIEGWTESGKRANGIYEADIAAIHKRRDELRALLDANAFLDLQKAVPEEIKFLEEDAQARLAAAIERAAAERTRMRRRCAAANTVISKLQTAGKVVPPQVMSLLGEIAAGNDNKADTDRAFADAYAILAGNNATGVAQERTSEIAARLAAGERSTSLTEWRAGNLENDEDERLKRIGERADQRGVDVVVRRPIDHHRRDMMGDGDFDMLRHAIRPLGVGDAPSPPLPRSGNPPSRRGTASPMQPLQK